MSSLARGASTPLSVGVGSGRRRCLMPGRLLVGDTTPTDQVAMVMTIVLKSCRRRHRTARGREVIAHAADQVEASGDRLVLGTGGGQLKLQPQPTAGGRTLVDADGSRRRIGDPGVDLTERACRPLIRLSTHPPAAARARVSEPRPSTSSLCPLLWCRPVPTPDHPGAMSPMRSGGVQPTAVGRTLVDAADQGGASVTR
ncbi:hypothetical protein EVAR_3457_1 [Eumeta japonica]|uniref:Uncharacterized protein n=1 Tax=Eumeta variegata TaxID=151549 RepID=A0A4C1SSN8_EUMVA|nr:hypothetical protein EVAR_3457_1 [Eumeta japonica]